mgnify:CR=1 FL=1
MILKSVVDKKSILISEVSIDGTCCFFVGIVLTEQYNFVVSLNSKKGSQ